MILLFVFLVGACLTYHWPVLGAVEEVSTPADRPLQRPGDYG